MTISKAELNRLGKDLGLAPIEHEETTASLKTALSDEVLNMPIRKLRGVVLQDGTDKRSRDRINNMIALNDAKCHGEAFRKGKANAKPRLSAYHKIKGKTYEFASPVTRSHAKSLVVHGYRNVIDEAND